jgi:transposase
MLCGKQKSLSKLRREITILQGFYQQQPAYRLVSDLGLDTKTFSRVHQRLRTVLVHTAELEGPKLSGEIEMDESGFGSARKRLRDGASTAQIMTKVDWI